jgi:hypothetical protein
MQCSVAELQCCSVAVLQCLLQRHWHGALARSTPTTFVLCVNANSSHNKKTVPELKSGGRPRGGGGAQVLMSYRYYSSSRELTR